LACAARPQRSPLSAADGHALAELVRFGTGLTLASAGRFAADAVDAVAELALAARATLGAVHLERRRRLVRRIGARIWRSPGVRRRVDLINTAVGAPSATRMTSAATSHTRTTTSQSVGRVVTAIGGDGPKVGASGGAERGQREGGDND
jgi:hypothetical protein